MVFGWGKKKTEETTKNSELRNIQLSEIQKITKNLLDLRHTQTLSEIKSLRKQIIPLLKELSNIVQSLEKDNLNVDDIDKHLRIIVVRGKKQVIDIIKKESLELPEVSSFAEALDMSNNLNQKLKKIGDVLGRQTRVIHIFAKKYAEELKKILSDMNSINSEIQNLTKSFQTSQGRFEEINELLQEVNNLKNDSSFKKSRISEFENLVTSSIAKIKEVEDKISQIKSSTLYKEYLSTAQKFESFVNTKSQINNEIALHFTKISRPLGRYEYVSSLEKDQKSLLSNLISDPFEVLIPANRDSIIVILENVRKGIMSNSISVKDVDKTMTYLTEIEEILDILISKVSEFLEKKKKIEDELKSFDHSELSSLENQLEKLYEQKTDFEEKILLYKKEVSENSENIPNKISQIENLLREFSHIEYTISKSSLT